MSRDTPQFDQNLFDNKKNLFVIHHKEEGNELNSFSLPLQSQDDSIESIQIGRWNKREHERFIVGILQHGNEWKKVEEVVKTRSSTQARSHAQKFFIKIKNNKQFSFGQFSTIKKFCEKIKSLDQPNKHKLLRELREIPFDSEDVPLKSKKKRKVPKRLKNLKKIKSSAKEPNASDELFNTQPQPNQYGVNQKESMPINHPSKSISNTSSIYPTNLINDNQIIYNNNINNLNINFLQQGFLNSQLSRLDTINPVPNINNSPNMNFNPSMSLLNNRQVMSLISDNYINLFASLRSNWRNMVNYLNQELIQYSPMFMQDLSQKYL